MQYMFCFILPFVVMIKSLFPLPVGASNDGEIQLNFYCIFPADKTNLFLCCFFFFSYAV